MERYKPGIATETELGFEGGKRSRFQVNVRVPSKMYDGLNQLSVKTGLNKSELCIKAIGYLLENPSYFLEEVYMEKPNVSLLARENELKFLNQILHKISERIQSI